MQSITFGSVCSGIEAASVAFEPLGWRAAWFAEIEPFPCAVLAHHYPDTPNLGDMTTIAARVRAGEVAAPDVLCGGTPCQSFSLAGLRRSLDDARGNLSLSFCELADAIDDVRCAGGKPASVVLWENVPGVLSTHDNAFGCFLAALAGLDTPLVSPLGWTDAGVVDGPRRAVAWRVLDAQFFGLAQRRRRVFVVASAREGFDPAAVLLEFDGVRRDTAPSREARQVAPTIPARSTAGGGLGTDFDCDGGLIQAYGGNNQSGPIDVATARNACASASASASASGRMDFETETFLVETAHTLRGEGFDASEDGTGRGAPLGPVAFAENSRHELRLEGGDGQRTGALSTGGGKPGQGVPMIAFPANLSGTQCASTEDLAPSMGAANPTAVAAPVHAIQAGALRTNPLSGPDGVGVQADHAYTLEARAEVQAVQHAMQVRRLTPTEAERLMGFPDGYTAIPWRGKPAAECPDGPRYKALGNSWAVPCVRWIGRRIGEAMQGAGA